MASLRARSSTALLADHFRQWHACAVHRVRCKRETAMRLRGRYVGRAFQLWRQHVAAWKSTRARLAAALGKLESSICTQVTHCIYCGCVLLLLAGTNQKPADMAPTSGRSSLAPDGSQEFPHPRGSAALCSTAAESGHGHSFHSLAGACLYCSEPQVRLLCNMLMRHYLHTSVLSTNMWWLHQGSVATQRCAAAQQSAHGCLGGLEGFSQDTWSSAASPAAMRS